MSDKDFTLDNNEQQDGQSYAERKLARQKKRRIPLTQFNQISGGSSSKWKPGEFDSIKNKVAPVFSQDAASGLVQGDDRAILHINEKQAAVLTLDWFPPVVDDPYEFGAISAASSLGELYAAGVKPIVALNIMALPCKLGIAEVGEVMKGGSDKIVEAGAFVVGGHSVDDDEPKYGLAAFGLAYPDKIVRNENARPGDVVFYTKPLGSGIMSEAFMAKQETAESMREAIDSMMELNKAAAEAMEGLDVHAASYVSESGLAGHLHELLCSCDAAATLYWESLPLLERAWKHCCEGYLSDRTVKTSKWASQFIDQPDFDDEDATNRLGILCDAQTSGGLIVVVSESAAEAFERAFESKAGRRAARIGVITEGETGRILVA